MPLFEPVLLQLRSGFAAPRGAAGSNPFVHGCRAGRE